MKKIVKKKKNEENNLNLIFPEEKAGRKSQHVYPGRIITFLSRP